MTFNTQDIKVIQGIKNALRDRGPEWVYPDEWRYGQTQVCTNLLPDGSAACIIGYIAVDQELPTEARDRDALDDAREWDVSEPVTSAMGVAQMTQDDRRNWGTAYENFRQEILTLSGIEIGPWETDYSPIERVEVSA